MAAINLKTWRFDNNIYTSPRFPDIAAYKRVKKFLIRSHIIADYDDAAMVIKINISSAAAQGNWQKLKDLELI